jgi:outer membrane protein assembly factor BamE (lipoprotein component of BamABCDE complex)
MRRRRLLIRAAVALAAAVLVLAALEVHAYRQKLARVRPIDWEHFERIKEGMSGAEVEAILGGPPGDYHTENIFYHSFGVTSKGQRDTPIGYEWWCGNKGAIVIRFDEQGKVQRHLFMDTATSEKRHDWVRDWLRRLWP